MHISYCYNQTELSQSVAIVGTNKGCSCNNVIVPPPTIGGRSLQYNCSGVLAAIKSEIQNKLVVAPISC